MTSEMAKKVSAYRALYDANTISEEQYLSFVRDIVNEEMSNKNLDVLPKEEVNSVQKEEKLVVEMPVVNEEVKVNENVIPTVDHTNEENNDSVKTEEPVVTESVESSNVVIPEEIKDYITKEGPTEKGKEVLNELLKEEPPKKPKAITTAKDDLKEKIKSAAMYALAYTLFILSGISVYVYSDSPVMGLVTAAFQCSAFDLGHELGLMKNMK